ncbi:hypothetical protein, unlikely [Trypanosoma brucei gambiense DAL972]|uniref:Uncharacterized protein n=1 Tax=Trypanosoma brucei gambiense (strain MHOM/CI/86/DAL972) TaxID=679716 RepID=D0A2Q1_TRYB9|nr:hypothetical protein, unlikely [Trypanosoma brucei gambiense DAL972]CBH15545.1 hypothetical protein, unlikely [Trypanosoma brucei gambiense DAL972]|eukprot:XP_011777809.1 hypothetical protein, unlikely [Trypanosoma brucei gambiense DAL972]
MSYREHGRKRKRNMYGTKNKNKTKWKRKRKEETNMSTQGARGNELLARALTSHSAQIMNDRCPSINTRPMCLHNVRNYLPLNSSPSPSPSFPSSFSSSPFLYYAL